MPISPLIASIPVPYVLAALAVALVLCILWIVRLEIRIRRLLRGKHGGDLEDTIAAVQTGQKELEQFRNEIETYLTNVERRLTESVRGIKTIRFNPFKGSGMGGNQSFATALLSENGDGVILSSMYARDRVSMFAKPISKYTSPHELTEEERTVLNEVRASLSKKRVQHS